MDTKTTEALIQAAPAHIREAWLSLTLKQRALAVALPLAKTKVDAFLAAGYSANSAKKKQDVPANVAEVAGYLAGAALKARVMDVQEVLGELCHSVRFDPLDIFDEHDCLKPMTQWPEHARRALASIEVFEEYTKGSKDNPPEFLGRTKKVKFIGKVEAADKLLRALGAYAPEKVEHTHRIEGMAGLLARIAAKGADVGPGPAASRR